MPASELPYIASIILLVGVLYALTAGSCGAASEPPHEAASSMAALRVIVYVAAAAAAALMAYGLWYALRLRGSRALDGLWYMATAAVPLAVALVGLRFGFLHGDYTVQIERERTLPATVVGRDVSAMSDRCSLVLAPETDPAHPLVFPFQTPDPKAIICSTIGVGTMVRITYSSEQLFRDGAPATFGGEVAARRFNVSGLEVLQLR